MAELTDQQGHLQQVLEQQRNLINEINELNNTVTSKREMAVKLQGVREYLEQLGVSLPESEEAAEGDAPTEAADTEVVAGE